MPRQHDPLTFIPSAAAVEKELREAETRAEKLRILLRVAQEIEAVKPATSYKEEAANA